MAGSSLSYVIVGLLGAAVGSFLNVVILRTHQDRPWWRGRSACPKCGHDLRWYELIPVFSFVALGGECRYCHHTLTRQYFLVEVLTVIAFIITFAHEGGLLPTLLAWLTVSVMIALAVYDARWSLLPDSFSIVFGLAAALFSVLSHRPVLDILAGGIGGALFFGLQFVLSRRQWVGSGDILLGAGLGLLLGWRWLTLCLFLAYLSGAIVAATLIITRRVKNSGNLAFGPYLLSAGFVSWMWGDRIIDWYFNHAIFR